MSSGSGWKISYAEPIYQMKNHLKKKKNESKVLIYYAVISRLFMATIIIANKCVNEIGGMNGTVSNEFAVLCVCLSATKAFPSYTSCAHVFAIDVKNWDRGKKWDWHQGHHRPKIHLNVCFPFAMRYKNPPIVHVMCACLGCRCQKVGQGQEMGQAPRSPWT